MSFVPLQVRSAYSLLDSTISIEALVARVKELGYSAVALTDTNTLYGAFDFYETCHRHGVQPILGLTADVLLEGESTAYPLVLLARNQDGYRNLVKISSALQTKAKSGLPLRWLQGYSAGLIALSPGSDGVIELALLEERYAEAKAFALTFQRIFGAGGFYLSLHLDSMALVSGMQGLSAETGIPLVAGSRVHYLERENRRDFDAIRCLRLNEKMMESDLVSTVSHHLPSSDEMAERFVGFEAALGSCQEIAAACQVVFDLNQVYLPKFPLPSGVSAGDYLRGICQKGFEKRYSEPTTVHFQRLDYELSVIEKMQFEDYFLIVWDFMRFARSRGIFVGPGRGSAAGSMVSYVLGITNVDPIHYELLFERFLNPERISMPDIDIDFPDNRREEMIRYVAEKYGRLHVAQIVTFGTFGAKAALRDAGRVFGLEPKDVDALGKLVPNRLNIRLVEAIAESPRLQALQGDGRYRPIIETALRWEGLPRHTSTHAAGVVMSEVPLTDIVPVQEGHDDVLLTQFPMEQLERLGLLKMDFLGLRNLSLIERIVREIQRTVDAGFQIDQIPLDDVKTYRLISRADTIGIFQLESDGQRSVLRKLRPSEFEDLIAVTALFRPGPMENIDSFIRRKYGQEPIDYLHEDLKPILAKTYGIIVYQEQILQIAAKMAGFTLGEADLLRKAVSKKRKDVLNRERKHFVNGAIAKGYHEQVANRVYDLIVKFANYGFNRSHATAYMMIAYQMAYLKANYPRFFTAELMTGMVGSERRIARLVQELRRQGVVVLPPSIVSSGYGFKPEGENGIRFGLAAIRGVSSAAIREILRARKDAPFRDFFDFVLRVPIKVVNQRVMEALIVSGCFDDFGLDRNVYLASLMVALEHASFVNPEGVVSGDLFEADPLFQPKYAVAAPMSVEEKLERERQVLGLCLSAHPTSADRERFKRIGTVPLLNGKKGDYLLCGVYLHRIKVIRTKKGEQMAFASISDESCEMDATVFPSVYRSFGHLLVNGRTLVMEGKVEENNGQLQLLVERIWDVEAALAEMGKAVYLRISESVQVQGDLGRLKRLLFSYKGNTKVVLHYEKTGETIMLGRKEWVTPSHSFLSACVDLLGESNVRVE